MCVFDRGCPLLMSLSKTHTLPFPVHLILPLNTQPFYVMKLHIYPPWCVPELWQTVYIKIHIEGGYCPWCTNAYKFTFSGVFEKWGRRETGRKKKKQRVSAGLIIIHDVSHKSSWTFAFPIFFSSDCVCCQREKLVHLHAQVAAVYGNEI